MAAEEAFVGAGQAPGLELWRIEAMAPVKQPEANGKFYSGDSYILLATTKSKTSNAMNWSIHFWLGSETSQVRGTTGREGGSPVLCRLHGGVQLLASHGGGCSRRAAAQRTSLSHSSPQLTTTPFCRTSPASPRTKPASLTTRLAAARFSTVRCRATRPTSSCRTLLGPPTTRPPTKHTAHRPPFTSHHAPLATRCPPTTNHRPPTTDHRPLVGTSRRLVSSTSRAVSECHVVTSSQLGLFVYGLSGPAPPPPCAKHGHCRQSLQPQHARHPSLTTHRTLHTTTIRR